MSPERARLRAPGRLDPGGALPAAMAGHDAGHGRERATADAADGEDGAEGTVSACSPRVRACSPRARAPGGACTTPGRREQQRGKEAGGLTADP